MPKSITIVSGGADSVTLAVYINKIGKDQEIISFNYGQSHSKELVFALEIAEELKAKFHQVDIEWFGELLHGGVLVGDGEVPEGHYNDDSMKATIVPNRNAIFLSIAYALAVDIGADEVNYGAHRGDSTTYPDCRPGFIGTLSKAFMIGNDSKIDIVAPFVHLSKGEIIKIGQGLGVDYKRTWTCYNGRTHHCGKCGACVERMEAFKVNGIPDPTIYEE